MSRSEDRFDSYIARLRIAGRKVIASISEIRGPLSFEDLVSKKGMFPSRVKRFCTEHLKVLPVLEYMRAQQDAHGDVVNAVGIRRDESKARSEMREWEWSDGFDVETWRPLVMWSHEDVIAIHARHGLAMNPLYAMGASRVGCWPCIHARKSEIALVARIDPARIDRIRDLERRLNDEGSQRDQDKDRAFVPRSMFNYHGGDDVHHPITIDEAVAWGNSKRGEWQPKGAGDACMRWGVCETDAEDA